MKAGLEPWVALHRTPRDLVFYLVGVAHRRLLDRRARIEAAWVGAAASRAKRMPPLKRMMPAMPGERAPRRMTREQKRAEWSLLKEQFDI